MLGYEYFGGENGLYEAFCGGGGDGVADDDNCGGDCGVVVSVDDVIWSGYCVLRYADNNNASSFFFSWIRRCLAFTSSQNFLSASGSCGVDGGILTNSDLVLLKQGTNRRGNK